MVKSRVCNMVYVNMESGHCTCIQEVMNEQEGTRRNDVVAQP